MLVLDNAAMHVRSMYTEQEGSQCRAIVHNHTKHSCNSVHSHCVLLQSCVHCVPNAGQTSLKFLPVVSLPLSSSPAVPSCAEITYRSPSRKELKI